MMLSLFTYSRYRQILDSNAIFYLIDARGKTVLTLLR